jgi:hypothetical protein
VQLIKQNRIIHPKADSWLVEASACKAQIAPLFIRIFSGHAKAMVDTSSAVQKRRNKVQ